jgi:hypothetical protein
MALPLAWLDGTEVARWWLAMASRAVRSRVGAEVIAEAEGEIEREEERVEEDISTATTHDGIRLCPRGTVATGGVRLLSHHHAWSRARDGDRHKLFKQPRWLTSGLGSISYFKSFLII